MATSNSPSADVISSASASTEPRRPRLLSFILYAGIASAPLRALAYVMGTPAAGETGLPSIAGIALEALGVYAIVSVLRWRKWAMCVWIAVVAVAAFVGAVSADYKVILFATLQSALLLWTVPPIWRHFR